MALNHGLEAYKQTESNYVKGIDSAHGRIKLVFDIIISNLENVEEKHPRTEFTSFGKCMNGLRILGSSLDMEKGGEIAAQLVELYDYCIRGLREYLSEKDVEKIKEIHQIISKLSEGWDQIDPDKLEQQ